MTPLISVIVTAVNGLPALDRCLRALRRQRGGIHADIIVAGTAQPGLREHLERNFPEVRLLYCEERIAIPELRAMGMTAATGDLLAITEDRCTPAETWLEEIARAHQSISYPAISYPATAYPANAYPVIGGPIEPDGIQGILNWAVYLCEYSSLMLPFSEGEAGGVAGNNASYRREVLARVPEQIKRECWEYFLHEELRRAGVKILLTPAVLVRKHIDFSFGYFLGQRFHYSRSFAGMRRERVSPPRRLLYAAIAPALPLLMTWRIAKPVLEKKRFRKELLLALPLLCAFMASYAAGEFAGYLFGGGRSLSKVE
jgi:GT2 family glycosyltransferase